MTGSILFFPALYPEELNKRVFRYSSPSVFEKTITKSSLWFTRCDCLNDYEDGEIVKKLYFACLVELFKADEIDQEFFETANMVDIKHLSWVSVNVNQAKQIECKPFVCCFSKEEDSLQMWQYYSKGGNYEGYNIGFRLKNLLNVNSQFVQIGAVIYDESIQKEYIKQVITSAFKDFHYNLEKNAELIEDREHFLNTILVILRERLIRLSCFFKRACFSGEKEIRIVLEVPLEEKYRDLFWLESETTEEPVQIKYRISHAMLIPYIEVKINPNNIESVTIGPITSSKDIGLAKNIEIVRDFTLSNLKHEIKVTSSSIPVRF